MGANPQDFRSAVGCSRPGCSGCLHPHKRSPSLKNKFSLEKAQLFPEHHLPHGLIQLWLSPLRPTPSQPQLISHLTPRTETRGHKSPSTHPALAHCHRHRLCLHTSEERLTGAADDAELQLGPAGKLVTQGDIFQSWNISILPNYTIVGLTCLGANKTKPPCHSRVRAHITHVHTCAHTHADAKPWETGVYLSSKVV